MSIVKRTLDFIMRHLLRARLPKNRRRKVGGLVRTYDRPPIKTLRTYTAGGDPIDDMIVFVLKEGGKAPSGFRVPPAEHGDT